MPKLGSLKSKLEHTIFFLSSWAFHCCHFLEDSSWKAPSSSLFPFVWIATGKRPSSSFQCGLLSPLRTHFSNMQTHFRNGGFVCPKWWFLDWFSWGFCVDSVALLWIGSWEIFELSYWWRQVIILVPFLLHAIFESFGFNGLFVSHD